MVILQVTDSYWAQVDDSKIHLDASEIEQMFAAAEHKEKKQEGGNPHYPFLKCVF